MAGFSTLALLLPKASTVVRTLALPAGSLFNGLYYRSARSSEGGVASLPSGWASIYSTALSTMIEVSIESARHTEMAEHLLLLMASASLSGISMLNSCTKSKDAGWTNSAGNVYLFYRHDDFHRVQAIQA